MHRSFVPVILSGGSGSRLWPTSRKLLPKQFLPLLSEHSMLQETALRVREVPGCESPIVVSNDEHRFLVAEHLRQAGVRPSVQILEPVGRNTAPAIAAAAFAAVRGDPAAMLCVLPSDHLIRDQAAFARSVQQALALAGEGRLVTFGMQPTEPTTGYGYIERGAAIGGSENAFLVKRFVEKPDAETARGFLASGAFYWNSGMFVFSAARYLAELQQFRPDIHAAVEKAIAGAVVDMDFLRLGLAEFSACPSESVDYAVMEKTENAAVLAADLGWSDVGSWSSLWEAGARDGAGNVVNGDVYLSEASNCYVRAEGRLVCVLGVDNVVVVETDDAILVANRDRAQEVKQVVEWLERKGRSEHVTRRQVYRPWGYYESIDAGDRFQVKRIMVNPGAALSLQMHHHRAEHWVVVSGTAKVTCDDKVTLLSENQSTYIPVGMKHRLENPGVLPLFLVEVQSGSYLGEDDIVRFEDVYKRA